MKRFVIFLLGSYLNFINIFSKHIGGRQAFLLFCYPVPLKLKPKQKQFLDTADSFKVNFEGKQIAGYRWGEGPKHILFLHGWQSQSYRWKKYIEAFDQQKYTLFAIDAPGHGNSEGTLFNIPMYARLIGQILTIHKIDCIVAHSLGAFSSLCLFYNNLKLSPNKVVILGTPGEANDLVDYFMKELRLTQRVRRNFLRYFWDYAGHGPEFYSAKEFAKKQTASALIIHDKDDLEAPYHYAETINQVWLKSKLITTENLGHKLRSFEVVESVKTFIEDEEV